MDTGAEAAAGGGLIMVIYLAVIVLVIASMWKTFVKAGQPGWAAIVPIYNVIVLLQIVGKPTWWVILFFVPIANIVISFIVMIEFAKVFGKGAGFGVGLALLGFIFLPILGFGSAEYQGGQAEAVAE